jgi:hypothetical protein
LPAPRMTRAAGGLSFCETPTMLNEVNKRIGAHGVPTQLFPGIRLSIKLKRGVTAFRGTMQNVMRQWV